MDWWDIWESKWLCLGAGGRGVLDAGGVALSLFRTGGGRWFEIIVSWGERGAESVKLMSAS